MTLKDILKKKERIHPEHEALEAKRNTQLQATVPEFTFIRTTTNTEEIITPPVYPGDTPAGDNLLARRAKEQEKRFGSFRRSSKSQGSASGSTEKKDHTSLESDDGSHQKQRLSQRLHLSRSHSASSATSANIPSDLPEIEVASTSATTATPEATVEKEAKWETRATILAQANPNARRGSAGGSANLVEDHLDSSADTRSVSDAAGDDGIQEAIRLHEEGQLEQSTSIFSRLADPTGANNALSQVLYGLALRHGWGVTPNPQLAITYLSYAASNSAQVEELALKAGMKKGGAAKGELVLAIFELGISFRNGWGVAKDLVAAKQYFETAANLGDTDAMNEVADCYVNGLGCKKDKFKAAQYLRLAEERGNKTVGNSWIWKDKYGGPPKKAPPKPKV